MIIKLRKFFATGLVFLVATTVFASSPFDRLNQKQEALRQSVSRPGFDCADGFKAVMAEMGRIQQTLGAGDVKAARAFLPTLFKDRLRVKTSLNLNSPACLNAVRNYFFSSRALQDQLFIAAQANEQRSIKGVDFLKIEVPRLDDPTRSFFNDAIADRALRPGDIMIAKGISFTSSTISRLPEQPSQFSHIAFFVNHEGRLHTLESYIGKGVDAYPLDEALKNENARILILRPKDARLAEDASRAIETIYQASLASGQKIKYDYKLDMKNHDALTCAEVAVTAYEKASAGRVIIPEFPSTLDFSNQDFVQTLGLKNGPIMMPDDMEFDSRFETILEWTEFTLLQDSLRKDQIMNLILSRVNRGEKVLQGSYKSKILDLLWKTRNTSWLWPLSAAVLGLAKDFDPGVPVETLKVSLDVDHTGQMFLDRLTKDDQDHRRQTGAWMNENQLLEKLKSYSF